MVDEENNSVSLVVGVFELKLRVPGRIKQALRSATNDDVGVGRRHSQLKNHRKRILLLVTSLMFVLLAVTGSFAAIPIVLDGPEAGLNAIPIILDEPPVFSDGVGLAEVVDEPPLTTHAIPIVLD